MGLEFLYGPFEVSYLQEIFELVERDAGGVEYLYPGRDAG